MTALINTHKNFLGARAKCLDDARARVGEPRGPREEFLVRAPKKHPNEIRWTPWSI